ncbi:hypothetical protein niasHT_007346 [Heterodera trifolii]|uniref:Mitochondrial 2-oxodicarboxylate carrier n=1 Tax=Heterodera trifolii TaxID=157864 RepID=A0ABD2LLE2_9BILA
MERAKEAGRQFVAGGTAGMVEVCLMHPLDLVKTRLQMGGGHYAGLADCFGQTFRREGVSGFYKGILPPILAETPKRATKFLTFEQYKRAHAPVATHWHLPPWACLSLAGLFCGLTEAFVICPFEVVKGVFRRSSPFHFRSSGVRPPLRVKLYVPTELARAEFIGALAPLCGVTECGICSISAFITTYGFFCRPQKPTASAKDSLRPPFLRAVCRCVCSGSMRRHTEQVVGRDGGRRKQSDERHRRLTAGARRAPANQSTACGSRADFFRSP